MCISISTPSSETIPTACLVGKSTVTVPFTGETNSPWLGSMTTPCPITPDEKTGSVAWLSGLTWPASGLTTSADSARTVGCTKPSEASLRASCACPSSSVFVKNPVLWKRNVNTIATTISTIMIIAKIAQYWGLIERIAGRPPIPIEFAWTPKTAESKPDKADADIPATNG